MSNNLLTNGIFIKIKLNANVAKVTYIQNAIPLKHISGKCSPTLITNGCKVYTGKNSFDRFAIIILLCINAFLCMDKSLHAKKQNTANKISTGLL